MAVHTSIMQTVSRTSKSGKTRASTTIRYAATDAPPAMFAFHTRILHDTKKTINLVSVKVKEDENPDLVFELDHMGSNVMFRIESPKLVTLKGD